MKPISVKKLRKLLKEFDQDMLVMVPGDHQQYYYLDKDSLGIMVCEPSCSDKEFEYANELVGEDYMDDAPEDDERADAEWYDFQTWRRVLVLEG